MARNTRNTRRIVLTTRGPASGPLVEEFGPVLALRKKPHSKWGWWVNPGHRSAAKFANEYEARCWLHQTFSHPVDLQDLHTEEV